MSRYFIQRQPVARDWQDDWPMLPDLSVPEHEPTDTGLVDALGNKIMRAPRPIGFGREKEW